MGLGCGRRPGAAPYAQSLQAMADIDWLPLHVPGHQSGRDRSPVSPIFGDRVMRMDLPMSMASVDQETWNLRGDATTTPMARSLRLAAQAWGASRVWWLTNGASGANHVACMAARFLGPELVVQRSVHSSVIDGLMMAGLTPHFVAPSMDSELGAAHGVTAESVREALRRRPASSAVYVVSPSYFGAVADIAGLAAAAHEHGVPLIVDEAWGSHFGFHPGLPSNAVREGADLVISSTHKTAGSLTQSAMLQLGHSEQAKQLEPAVERAHRAFQSTSSSALLMMSLDETRRHLAVEGKAEIGRTLTAAEAIRAGVRRGGRFAEVSERVRRSPGAVDLDPLKIVIHTSVGGIGGREAQHLLLRDHRVAVEMSTHSTIVLLLGAIAEPDVDRFLGALHQLPRVRSTPDPAPELSIPARRIGIREAFFHPYEEVSASEAVGRVSADALAAYPPGIPNVLPGEVLTAGTVHYLRATAATAAGYVRGAVDSRLDHFRVLGGRG
ncbi:aminotransferase class I/II-fold pyridoxal phosphate-dependent enzyme [Flexivirga alba]|uniref:Aminotransferase class I/II-fold pyridoxal phosphate-dependent enzyme n=1 Tax=Flexivirga alba TaxID=702742 RepID=A0ABW2AAM4_9MICO